MPASPFPKSLIVTLFACITFGCSDGSVRVSEDVVDGSSVGNGDDGSGGGDDVDDDIDTDAACFSPMGPGVRTVTVAQDGVTRSFNIYVPTTYTGQDSPLVFLLHGSYGSGDGILNIADPAGNNIFQANADENGYLIAAPTGAVELGNGFAWNIPGVPLVGSGVYPTDQSLDDIEYIGLSIDAVGQTLCVDETMVYVTGFSGGGRMTSQLGCDLSDRIAAIAPMGGVRAPAASDTPPNTVDCAPTRAVPMLAIHGTADIVNEFYDDDPGIDPGSSWTYGVPEAMDRWAAINSCMTTDPLIEQVAPQVELIQYQSCDANTQLYRYGGMGHVIPGTTTGSDPAAPKIIWDFFSQQRIQ